MAEPLFTREMLERCIVSKTLRARYLRRDVWSVGFRLGWWPCVGGPFVQVNVGRRYLSVWYGYPLTTIALEP